MKGCNHKTPLNSSQHVAFLSLRMQRWTRQAFWVADVSHWPVEPASLTQATNTSARSLVAHWREMYSEVELREQHVHLRDCIFDTAEAAIDALRTCPPQGYADKGTAQAALKKGTIKWTYTVFIAAQTLVHMAKVGLPKLYSLVHFVLKNRAF